MILKNSNMTLSTALEYQYMRLSGEARYWKLYPSSRPEGGTCKLKMIYHELAIDVPPERLNPSSDITHYSAPKDWLKCAFWNTNSLRTTSSHRKARLRPYPLVKLCHFIRR